jgi:hypothetical protein
MMGIKNGTAMQNSLVLPQKTKNRIIIRSSTSISRYVLQRIESRLLNIYLNIIQNSQKEEATQIFTHR